MCDWMRSCVVVNVSVWVCVDVTMSVTVCVGLCVHVCETACLGICAYLGMHLHETVQDLSGVFGVRV